MGATLDEASTFFMWAVVLVGVEDRLGIPTPGIPDGEVFGTKPIVELTLRDLARTVAGHAPPGEDPAASRWMLESAGQVAGRPVSEIDLDLPLLQALRVPHWADKHGRTRRCT